MSDIIETKTLLKSQLNAYAGLTALVPVARILSSWPDSFATLPLITFNELDNFNTDEDMFDDQPICDTSQVEIHIWQKPGVSTTPIFKQLNACMAVSYTHLDVYKRQT